jgi:hypothetical protein
MLSAENEVNYDESQPGFKHGTRQWTLYHSLARMKGKLCGIRCATAAATVNGSSACGLCGVPNKYAARLHLMLLLPWNCVS